jgi:hypothetical protein
MISTRAFFRRGEAAWRSIEWLSDNGSCYVAGVKGQLDYCPANQFVNGRLNIAAALPR